MQFLRQALLCVVLVKLILMLLFLLYLCSLLMQTEWEALELTDHQWALEDVEEELMAKDLHFEGMFKEELQTSIF